MATKTPESSTKAETQASDKFSPEFLKFFEQLQAEFEPRRQNILAERAKVLERAQTGSLPTYGQAGAVPADYTIGLPDWAKDQRNQITGPADNAKLLIGMCNSGAPGCMPDGEDSITTDWRNVRASQQNTIAAIKGTLSFEDPETGKKYRIAPSEQLVFFRPRGLRLCETNFRPGAKVSGSIFDLSSVFFETAAERKAAVKNLSLQRKLCFYIPKIESAQEAGWWSDLLAALERGTGIPEGATKVMFLIESLPAAFQVDEILYAARRHVIGLNLGRWDYMASLIHFKLADPSWILPDRNTIPHDIPFFQNLRYRIVELCHRRKVFAIGGMTALFPNRKDPALNDVAMKRLAADKKNEAAIGFDGAWTGHPDQQQVAVEQFPAPNQLQVRRSDMNERPDLTPSPMGVGRVTVSGTKDAIRTVIEYRYGVLSGLGARLIPGYDPKGQLIGGFMEDLATDRIYRLMIAQRIRHKVKKEEGTVITASKVTEWFDEELSKLLSVHKEAETQARYKEARKQSESMITKGEFDPS